MRSSWNSSAKQALCRFRPRDLRDLQVWSNLAWVHPLLFEKDPELAEFKEKGRYYTEDEKHWFLDKQRELLAEVIPLHRELAERGQIELTTTPFLPPDSTALTRQDARRGRRCPTWRCRPIAAATPTTPPRTCGGRSRATLRHFGERPRGMWPQRGLGLPGTDTAPGRARHRVDRDRRGDPRLFDRRQDRSRQPGSCPPSRIALSGVEGPRVGPRAGDHLSRPFDVRPDRVSLSAKSRPGRGRRLSGEASRDRRRMPAQSGDAGPGDPRRRELLGVLPDGGVSFLRSLYQGVARDPRVRPVKIGEFLRAASRLPTRSTGSSPGAGSATISPSGSATPKTTAAGMLCMSPASSWSPRRTSRPARSRGPGQSLGRDLHRPGLRLVLVVRRRPLAAPSTRCSTTYSASTCATSTRFWAAIRPARLFTPISRAGAHKPLHDPAGQLLRKSRSTAAPRISSGSTRRAIVCGNDRGTMTLVARGVLHAVWFGFDAERLLIRVDTEGGPARERLAGGRSPAHRLRRPGGT